MLVIISEIFKIRCIIYKAVKLRKSKFLILLIFFYQHIFYYFYIIINIFILYNNKFSLNIVLIHFRIF